MDVRPDLQIQAMLTAMRDVIVPAVDPDNKLAQEQAHLVIGTLQLIARRQSIAYQYDCDELQRYVRFAETLSICAGAEADPELAMALSQSAASGSSLLERPRVPPSEIEAAIFDLRALTGELIQNVWSCGAKSTRKALFDEVLAMSRSELDRELAMVVDMGFQTDQEKQRELIEHQLGVRVGE